MLSTVKSRNGEQIQTRKVYYKDNRSRNGEMEKYSKQFTATALFFNSEKKNLSFEWKKNICGIPIEYHNDKSRIISILIFLSLLFGTSNSCLIPLHKHITGCDKLNLSCTVFLLPKCLAPLSRSSVQHPLSPLEELWGESFTSSASKTQPCNGPLCKYNTIQYNTVNFCQRVLGFTSHMLQYNLLISLQAQFSSQTRPKYHKTIKVRCWFQVLRCWIKYTSLMES